MSEENKIKLYPFSVARRFVLGFIIFLHYPFLLQTRERFGCLEMNAF